MTTQQPTPGLHENFASVTKAGFGLDHCDELAASHPARLGQAEPGNESNKPDLAAELDGEVGSLEHDQSPFADQENTGDRADLLTEVTVVGRTAPPPPGSHAGGYSEPGSSYNPSADLIADQPPGSHVELPIVKAVCQHCSRTTVVAAEIVRAAIQPPVQHLLTGMTDEIINLVIAAREAFDCAFLPEEESRALDRALEPFSSKVRYANEPDATTEGSNNG